MAVVRLGSQVNALTSQINELQIEERKDEGLHDTSMSFEEEHKQGDSVPEQALLKVKKVDSL